MTIPQDLQFTLRQLRRSPGFTLTAVLTLALGVGATTAIFSLLDQALLRALPVREPQQLVVLKTDSQAWEGHSGTKGGDEGAYFSYPMYKDLRDRNQALEGLIATTSMSTAFTWNGAPQQARAEVISGNYFTMLGVRPAAGRLFTQNDDTQPGANPVVVLSFTFWKNMLGADPHVLGSTVMLNAQPFQVVGVAAPEFQSAVWGEVPDVFVPMSMLPELAPERPLRLTDHRDRWLNIIGRLKPGESRAQAQAAMQPLWHALRADELKALPEVNDREFIADFLTHSHLLLLPGAAGFSYTRDDIAKPLFVMMAMAALVLLIATTNVASLLLVRSAGRVKEFSLRYALGAGGGRIMQQLLIEGVLIGVAGGAAGIVLAPLAVRGLLLQLSGDAAHVAFTSSVSADLLAFNFAVALVVSIVFSLAPAMELRRPSLTTMLCQNSPTASGAMLRFRRAVVAVQVGLSVLLLMIAGLLVRSMQNLRHAQLGFTQAHLITFGVYPRLSGYTAETIPALNQRILDRMTALPGVQSVGATDDRILAGNTQGGNVSVQGYTAPGSHDFEPEHAFVTPSYFSTLQVPLLAGRFFTESDDAAHPHVAIVTEAFARHVCGTIQSCIGRMMSEGHSVTNGKLLLDTEIVGVVGDTKHEDVRSPVLASWFRPVKQADVPPSLTFYLRTFADPAQMTQMVRHAMQQLDPKLPLFRLRTMDAQIEDSLANERTVSLLAISFGFLATLLAGIGLYGVLAYSTTQRTREIGIRIALGSSRLAISGLVLRDVLLVMAAGIVIALPVAFAVARLLRSQLFGVAPADPLTLLGVIALLVLTALCAALLPARRAVSVDPMQVLRNE